MRRASWLVIAVMGCGSPPRAATPAVPATVRLEWRDAPGNENPGPEEHALALFRDDEWNRALPCPRDLDAEQPDDPGRHRCAYHATGALGLAGTTVWTAAAVYSHEFDGMYSQEQSVVVLAPGPPVRVIATLVQWGQDVVDCRTTLLQRRQRTADLDGGPGAELCIESIEEAGVGLFEAMDLDERGDHWRPNRRVRRIEAFAYDVRAGRLVRRPSLDGRCPRTGYEPFVPGVARVDDAIAWRATVQGDDAPAPCPHPDDVNSCFDICDEREPPPDP